mgnify:FL=1
MTGKAGKSSKKTESLAARIHEAQPVKLSGIKTESEIRTATGFEELDRVLGGGIVAGSLVLVGGDPGIGKSTILLQVCKNLTEKGKKVFLYTDSACTYQFYEHRGFELAQEKDITLKIGNKEVALRCLLYSKVLG